MKKVATLKIPLLKLDSGTSTIFCLERKGICVANVRQCDPLGLGAGEKFLLQEALSEKKYLTVVIAIQPAEHGDRYYIVRSCPGSIPPDSAIQDCAERLHDHAVANGLTGSPFHR
jgi:hypothetical protein